MWSGLKWSLVGYNAKDHTANYESEPIVVCRDGKRVRSTTLITFEVKDEDDYWNMHLLTGYPNEYSIIDCRGDKCRHDFTFMETSVWCESCNGDYYEERPAWHEYLKTNTVFDREIPGVISCTENITPLDAGEEDALTKRTMEIVNNLKLRVSKIQDFCGQLGFE